MESIVIALGFFAVVISLWGLQVELAKIVKLLKK